MASYAGNVDQPINPENNDNDLLKVGPYIEGLSDFIKNCSTPMTIAIQGDWGTGKTSMMNMIKHKISSKNSEPNSDSTVHTLWFNTWQYSQFNMSENLPISLLSYLVEKICVSEENAHKENMPKLKEGFSIITKISIKAALSYAGISQENLTNEVKANFAEELETLKSNFESNVHRLRKNT